MKRLFALIGITCLSTLAVVLYFDSLVFVNALIAINVLFAVFFAFVKIKRKRRYSIAICAFTVMLSCVLFVFYQHNVYMPIVNNYSDNEIKFTGYVCDEVYQTSYNRYYYIQTNTVNGDVCRLKISLSSAEDLHIAPFEELEGTVVLQKTDSNHLISRNIYLTADAEDASILLKNGIIRKTSYYYAVKARTALKQSLDSLFDEKYSSLCKAVLLGDKQALSPKVRNDFSLTGTTYMIVVSGMHLSIIASFIIFLFKKITSNRFIISGSVILASISYMAITGFTFSVVRAGIMIIIAYCGKIIFRQADSLNSLGIAALLMCIQNPFVVGDAGLLCSFSATLGIVLWSERLMNFIVARANFKLKIIKYLINLLCVSVCAQIWVLPVAFIFFKKISLFTILLSVICSFPVSVLLVCSLISAILNLCPMFAFAATPFAFITKISAWIVLLYEDYYASIPYCSISTDSLYMYIWLGVTVLLSIIGLIIKNNRYLYIKCTIIISFVALGIGWSLSIIYNYYNPLLTVWSVGSGTTITVENGLDISFLSCGGKMSAYNDISEKIGNNYLSVKTIVVPQYSYKYTSYIKAIVSEFDETNILLYHSEENKSMGIMPDAFYYDDTELSIGLGSGVKTSVLCIDEVTYQLVESGSVKVLLIPDKGNVTVLPDDYLDVDYVVCDGLPENYNLLDCETIIFSGTYKKYKESYNSLREITEGVIRNNNNIKISLSDGGCNAEN